VGAAVRNGSKIVLVRIWAEDGNAEQEIKRVVGSRARLCPLCNPAAIRQMKAYKSVLVSFCTAEEVRNSLNDVSRWLKAKPSTAVLLQSPDPNHVLAT